MQGLKSPFTVAVYETHARIALQNVPKDPELFSQLLERLRGISPMSNAAKRALRGLQVTRRWLVR